MYYWDALSQSEKAQDLIEGLPKAQLVPVEMEGVENPSDYHASVVEGSIVGMVTKKYVLVQHSEAFMPIIKALDNAGEEYSVSVWSKNARAGLRVITGKEAEDGVKLGFQILNSVDGTTAINYMFRISRQINSHMEIVGYRKVCSNGMVIRVPLEEAEFVREELRAEIKTLMKRAMKIAHVGDAKEKAESVQYIVEALSLLKEPVSLMIEKAKKIDVLPEEAKKLIAIYLGKRMTRKCWLQFMYDKEKEGTSIWGLYNAMTYVASHETVSDSSKKSILDNSADFLKDAVVKGKEVILAEAE
jgi:hypothetical protein